MNKLKHIFILGLFHLSVSLAGYAQILKIDIYPLKTNEGLINLTVYRDKETFAAETPYRTYLFKKAGLEINKITVSISDLDPGTYGIALFDDVNRNGKIDYCLFVPCEGFGFSNYEFKKRRKPEFEWFAFELGDSTQTVRIPVFYF
ncbi:MAG: DUF2141 domain-containing protein [Prolixibacteraceae bacterium]|nr:DUF2141 domain-containing protein [Prolixibacteraceae bacterium]